MKPHRRTADLPVRYNAVTVLEHNLEERPDKTALLTPERELGNQILTPLNPTERIYTISM